MKRRLFFLLERLKITPSERKAISGLLIMLMVSGMLNLALTPSQPFSGDQYRELEQQFRKRTALLRQKEQNLLARYYPDTAASPQAAYRDTTPKNRADSVQLSPKENPAGIGIVRVNINTAAQSELESLPGIGPAYARRIVEYRKENGAFTSIEELKKIKGIAQKRLDKLKPFVKLKDPE